MLSNFRNQKNFAKNDESGADLAYTVKVVREHASDCDFFHLLSKLTAVNLAKFAPAAPHGFFSQIS